MANSAEAAQRRKVYWSQIDTNGSAAALAAEHALAATDILNTFAEEMMNESGGFMSTPPCLTKAHIHAALATAYAGLAQVDR